MGKMTLPRLDLDTFAEENFGIPKMSVEPYIFDGHYFIIKDRQRNPVKDYISPNRRAFYKIFHITGGTGILTVGLHQYHLNPGNIAFLHPDEIMSWQTTSTDTAGHFCLIHPEFFENAAHLIHLFRTYPFFKASKSVIQLDEDRSSLVNQCFESILCEYESRREDKKQAILLYMQMIMLESQRAGRNLADVAVPDHYRYIHGFLTLLEENFQVKSPDTVVKIKTATEFADQLNVHPNYLNSLVKAQTGKTLREHIQERLRYEAKVLLMQTAWDIRTISYVLGFSEQAAFTSFFNKKEKLTPSAYRENAVSRLHL
jgi:AraC family transcriptional activator of pobA